MRFGRVPKREKARLVEEMARASARSLMDALAAELDDDTTVLEACDAAFATLAHNVQLHACASGTRSISDCPLRSTGYLPTLKAVVEFSTAIPGFHLIFQQDRVQLLKGSVFQAVLLAILPMRFSSSFASPFFLASRVSGESGRFFTDSLIDFVQRFRQLGLNERQLGLLCALAICHPEGVSLQQPSLAQAVHERLCWLLHGTLVCVPGAPSVQLVLAALTDLRTLHTLHQEKLQAIRFTPTDWCMSSSQGSSSDESVSASVCLKKESLDSALPLLDHGAPPSVPPVIHRISPSSTVLRQTASSDPALQASPQERTPSFVDRHRALASLLERPSKCVPLAPSRGAFPCDPTPCDEEPLNLSLKKYS